MANSQNLKPWKTGQSGNIKGKPKGTVHLSTRIRKLLDDESFEANILDAKTGIRVYKGAPIDAIIMIAITKAVNGDDKAREWLAKYGWGKPTEEDIDKGDVVVFINTVPRPSDRPNPEPRLLRTVPRV